MRSDWDGPLGENDPDDNCVIPQAIMNLHNPVEMRAYDLSGMGPGDDACLEVAHNPDNGEDDIADRLLDSDNHHTCNTVPTLPTKVWKLSLAEFRKRLIIHFDIAYQRHEIKWPSIKKQTSYQPPPEGQSAL